VYYRVYTEDGAIPSKCPVYSDDPYLARIWAQQVALPRTVMSLKRCLSAVEHIGNYKDTSLFQSAKSDISMADTSHVSLASGSGPGSTPDNPMLLFAKVINIKAERLEASRPEVALLPPREGTTPFKAQYCRFFTDFLDIYLDLILRPAVYYRIYTEDGATISKQPVFGSGNLSLGRIDINTITPPHTIDSVKLRIAKAEQLDNARNAKLFTDMSSESPMDVKQVSILNSNRPGSDAEHPMVYVHLCSVQLRATQNACQSTFKACTKLFTHFFFSLEFLPGVAKPHFRRNIQHGLGLCEEVPLMW
jgi:hypothetical protein